MGTMKYNKAERTCPVCIYHKADLDGVCSAAIVGRFVKDIRFIGVDHGEPFNIGDVLTEECREQGIRRAVYIVDFCFDEATMRRLAEEAELVWIDHHRTSIDAMDDAGLSWVGGKRRVGYAACELCWDFFHKPDTMLPGFENYVTSRPAVVRLLGSYDVWRKDHPAWDDTILPFQYGMRSWVYAHAPSMWNATPSNGFDLFGVRRFDDPTIRRFVDNGKAVLRYRDGAAGFTCDRLPWGNRTLTCVAQNDDMKGGSPETTERLFEKYRPKMGGAARRLALLSEYARALLSDYAAFLDGQSALAEEIPTADEGVREKSTADWEKRMVEALRSTVGLIGERVAEAEG